MEVGVERMNDREKLIELISGSGILCEICGENSFQYCAEALVDHLLDNGVTFATDTNDGGKWISVGDGLPTDEKPVLVYYGFMRNENASTGLRYTGTLSYFCFDHQPHWQHESTGLVVTHWMPLPEPPAATLNQGQEL